MEEENQLSAEESNSQKNRDLTAIRMELENLDVCEIPGSNTTLVKLSSPEAKNGTVVPIFLSPNKLFKEKNF